MKIPVYVAGASRELPRVQRYVELLESSGLVQITHRWFDAVAAWGVGRDAELTLEQQANHAADDLTGVMDAALVWVLWPENHSAGAFIEFGFAYGRAIPLVVSGAKASQCIFSALAAYRDPEDDCALHEVMRRVRKRIGEASR
ncbi:MAG TPA: hypothetical protein VFZ61_03785 [Polyangiales bacterium]